MPQKSLLTRKRLLDLLIVAIVCLVVISRTHSHTDVSGQLVTLTQDDRQREYRIHVPVGYAGDQSVPLVLMLHGGQGTAEQASRMGMSTVADRYGFIVAYPKGIDKHWNDGRESELFREHEQTVDDVQFLSSVVQHICDQYRIDGKRIFIAGISNGGFMSHRMVIECSDLFAAGGVVIATLAEPLWHKFAPQRPVSMLFMNGTADRFVPYEGGDILGDLFPRLAQFVGQPSGCRGRCISTDDAIALWLDRNGLQSQQPPALALPDENPDDGSQVEYRLWTGGLEGTSVALYRVVGGGHNIPGGSDYLPKQLIGRTNHDIDGLEAIWRFFSDHGRQDSR